MKVTESRSSSEESSPSRRYLTSEKKPNQKISDEVKINFHEGKNKILKT